MFNIFNILMINNIKGATILICEKVGAKKVHYFLNYILCVFLLKMDLIKKIMDLIHSRFRTLNLVKLSCKTQLIHGYHSFLKYLKI